MTIDVGVVLAGGESRRMGRPKALLPWRGRTLVEQVVAVLRDAGARSVVVVTSDAVELPPGLGATIIADTEAGTGPLGSIRDGLRAVAEEGERAFVTSVDLPFLSTAFIKDLASHGPTACAVEGEYPQPLAAIYETRLGEVAHTLLASGAHRPLQLLRSAKAVEVDIARLCDPEALRNCNSPERYLQALEDDGQREPFEIEFLGLSRTQYGIDRMTFTPRTLGDALREVGRLHDGLEFVHEDQVAPQHLVALEGRRFIRDAGIPIGPGEHLQLIDAAAGG